MNFRPKAISSLILILACIMLLQTKAHAGHWEIVGNRTANVDPERYIADSLLCGDLRTHSNQVIPTAIFSQPGDIEGLDAINVYFPHQQGIADFTLTDSVTFKWAADPGEPVQEGPDFAVMMVSGYESIFISARHQGFGVETGSAYVNSSMAASSTTKFLEDISDINSIDINGNLTFSGDNVSPWYQELTGEPEELVDQGLGSLISKSHSSDEIAIAAKQGTGVNATYTFNLTLHIHQTKEGHFISVQDPWYNNHSSEFYQFNLATNGFMSLANDEPIGLYLSDSPGVVGGEGGPGCACDPVGVGLFSGNKSTQVPHDPLESAGSEKHPSMIVNSQSVPNGPNSTTFPAYLPPWGNTTSAFSIHVEDEALLRNYWNSQNVDLNANSNFGSALGYIYANPSNTNVDANRPFYVYNNQQISTNFSALGGTNFGYGANAVGTFQNTQSSTIESGYITTVNNSLRNIVLVDADGTRIPFNGSTLASIDGATSILSGGNGTYTLHAGPPGNLREFGSYIYTFNTHPASSMGAPLSFVTKIQEPNNTQQIITYNTNSILVQDQIGIGSNAVSTGKSLQYRIDNSTSRPYIAGLTYNGASYERYQYQFNSIGNIVSATEGDGTNYDTIYSSSTNIINILGKTITATTTTPNFAYGNIFAKTQANSIPKQQRAASITQGGVKQNYTYQQLGNGSQTTVTESNRTDASGNALSDTVSKVWYLKTTPSLSSKVGSRITSSPTLNGTSSPSVTTELFDSRMRPTTVKVAREGTNNYYQSSVSFGSDPDLPTSETASVVSGASSQSLGTSYYNWTRLTSGDALLNWVKGPLTPTGYYAAQFQYGQTHGSLTNPTTALTDITVPLSSSTSATWQMNYDSLQHLTSMKAAGHTNSSTIQYYTPSQNSSAAYLPFKTTDEMGRYSTIDAYDSLGYPTQTSFYASVAGSPISYSTQYAYDKHHQVTQVLHSDNSEVDISYTLNSGQLFKPQTITNEMGKIVTLSYSCSSCSDKVSNITVGNTYVIDLDYINGDLSRVWDASHAMGGSHDPSTSFDWILEYAYGAQHELTEIHHRYGDAPTTGTDKFTKELFNYNCDGSLKNYTTTNGVQVQFSTDYSVAGQIKETIHYPTSSGMGDYVYISDLDGDLLQATDNTGTYAYSYNQYSKRLTSVTRSFADLPGLTYTFSYTYNADGSIASETISSTGVSITPYNSSYTYDDSGMLTNMALDNGDAWSWDYDQYCGRLIKQTCAPYQSGHTMVSSYGYSADDKSLLTSVFHKKDNTSTKASFSYSNNLDGSISGLSETVGALSGTNAYTYSTLGGLATDTRTNSYAYGNSYSYSGDNLTQITNGNAVTNLNYNWNQLTAASSTTGGQNFSASYDNPATAPGYGSGSVKTFNDGTTTWHYSYDVDGNLISVSAGSTVVYTATYDGLGRICKENDNGAITYWLYDAGGNQSLALDGAGNLNSQYIWGPTGILASYYNPVTAVPEDGFSMGSSMSSSASSENTFEAIIEKRFYFDDGRGNIRLLTDESINQTARYAYDSWGNDLDASLHSGVSQPFTWNGGNGYTHSDSTNLYHAGARSYNARMKQWLQRDPIDFDSGTADLYAYCGFDSANSIDPDGLEPYFIFDGETISNGLKISGAALLKALSLGHLKGGKYSKLAGFDGSENCWNVALLAAPIPSGGKIAGVIRGAKLLKIAKNAEAIEKGGYTAYQVMKDGKVIYVGITKNFERRLIEQLKRGLSIKRIHELLDHLSLKDAHAVEQVLIELHKLGKNGGTLLNKINSIAKNNPCYSSALKRGYDLLKQAGYPGLK